MSDPPGARVTGGCEPPDVGGGTELSPDFKDRTLELLDATAGTDFCEELGTYFLSAILEHESAIL